MKFRRYNLQHKVKGKWEETPHRIEVHVPDAEAFYLNWESLDEAFRGVLEIACCQDKMVNFEQVRTVITEVQSSGEKLHLDTIEASPIVI